MPDTAKKKPFRLLLRISGWIIAALGLLGSLVYIGTLLYVAIPWPKINIGSEPNYIPTDPFVTPPHIVPDYNQLITGTIISLAMLFAGYILVRIARNNVTH